MACNLACLSELLQSLHNLFPHFGTGKIKEKEMVEFAYMNGIITMDEYGMLIRKLAL